MNSLALDVGSVDLDMFLGHIVAQGDQKPFAFKPNIQSFENSFASLVSVTSMPNA